MDTDYWSFREEPELTDEARRVLDAVVGRIQKLESVLRARPTPIHPDSTFASDDRVMAPLHASATARTPLFVALDHLTFQGAALRELSRLQPMASYAPLRPAMEGAAWAIWMLAPTGRDERVLRALQYVLLDQTGFRRTLAAGGVTPEPPLDDLKAELAEITARLPSISEPALFRTPTAASVIEIASREVGVNEALAVQLWMALSALAHGRPHGITTLLQRDQLDVGTHGERLLRVEASLAIIASGTQLALAFVEKALDLYTSHCSPSDTVEVSHP